MNWARAQHLILQNIFLNQQLDTSANYKIVREVSPYNCFNNGFNGGFGFRIQVGRNSFIDVPLDMLQRLLALSVSNGYLYNNTVFKSGYLLLLKNKPCYVHAIGGIFTQAGVATKCDDGRNYIINR